MKQSYLWKQVFRRRCNDTLLCLGLFILAFLQQLMVWSYVVQILSCGWPRSKLLCTLCICPSWWCDQGGKHCDFAGTFLPQCMCFMAEQDISIQGNTCGSASAAAVEWTTYFSTGCCLLNSASRKYCSLTAGVPFIMCNNHNLVKSIYTMWPSCWLHGLYSANSADILWCYSWLSCHNVKH